MEDLEKNEVLVMTREEILDIQDMEIKRVQVQAWGNRFVCLKPFSARSRDQWEAEIYTAKKEHGDAAAMNDFRAKLLARSICNEEGVLLFSSADIELLTLKNAKAMDYLYDVCRELNGMTETEMAKATENLPEGQSVV